MNEVRLIQINIDGTPHEDAGILSKQAADVCAQTVALYRTRGFNPPWVGYLAMQGLQLVGTCAFTDSPKDGRVEIAYFTFPEFEGRGIATSMAKKLIEIAQATNDHLVVFAQTLPVVNASNSILKKLGFKFAGEVSHPEEGMVWEWQLHDIY
ncbi:GNAT family N-acetyltransferase [bacterium]|nr:GNAT family N-acetyltransferase [bacterium]